MEVSSVGIMYYAALVPCICAALVARQTALFLGVQTDVFRAPASLPLSLPSGLRVVFLAACCAGVSILFCLMLQLAHELMAHFFRNLYLRIVCGGVLLILLTLLVGSQNYLGTGMNIIEEALTGQALPWAFFLKMLFTSITIAAGFKGGEIVPSLRLLPGSAHRPARLPGRGHRHGVPLLRRHQLPRRLSSDRL